MTKESRCLGLVGGLGPGATVHYYRALVAAHAAEGRVARMMIAHADVDRVLALAGANDLENLAQYLAGVIGDLKSGGAERAAIVAITPHICAPELARLSPLPVVDMVTTLGEALRARNLKRVALFGTRSVVASAMFGRLEGIDVVMTRADEIETIHNIYVDIVAARQTAAQIDRLRELARGFVVRDGAETILLAGTDLSTVLDESNAGFPILDCAAVHIDAIMDHLLPSPGSHSAALYAT